MSRRRAQSADGNIRFDVAALSLTGTSTSAETPDQSGDVKLSASPCTSRRYLAPVMTLSGWLPHRGKCELRTAQCCQRRTVAVPGKSEAMRARQQRRPVGHQHYAELDQQRRQRRLLPVRRGLIPRRHRCLRPAVALTHIGRVHHCEFKHDELSDLQRRITNSPADQEWHEHPDDRHGKMTAVARLSTVASISVSIAGSSKDRLSSIVMNASVIKRHRHGHGVLQHSDQRRYRPSTICSGTAPDAYWQHPLSLPTLVLPVMQSDNIRKLIDRMALTPPLRGGPKRNADDSPWRQRRQRQFAFELPGAERSRSTRAQPSAGTTIPGCSAARRRQPEGYKCSGTGVQLNTKHSANRRLPASGNVIGARDWPVVLTITKVGNGCRPSR